MTPSESDELFQLSDFEGIEVLVSLDNITSKTGFKHTVRTVGDTYEEADETSRIRLMELHPSGVALDVPCKIAAQGHAVQLTFDAVGVSLPFTFEATGNVSEMQSISPERDRLVVKFTEFEPRFFDALKNLYAERQRQIEEFLFQAKG